MSKNTILDAIQKLPRDGKHHMVDGSCLAPMTVHAVQDLIADFAATNTTIANRAKPIDGPTSDGYHTFDELYEFRKLYNAALFNEWAALKRSRELNRLFHVVDYNVHKSKRHSDGELCFGGGWFIVQATLPTGQISNHYKLEDWDLFQCEERELADKFDGHTPADVADRLRRFLEGK